MSKKEYTFPKDTCWTPPQYAAYLGMNVRDIDKAIESGELEAINTGNGMIRGRRKITPEARRVFEQGRSSLLG